MSEPTTNPRILVTRKLGRKQVSFLRMANDTQYITLPVHTWNYGAIVSALVRKKYSADEVEAILSNNFALMGSASTVSEDVATGYQSEFTAFLEYRETCKARAKELMELGESDFELEEMYD